MLPRALGCLRRTGDGLRREAMEKYFLADLFKEYIAAIVRKPEQYFSLTLAVGGGYCVPRIVRWVRMEISLFRRMNLRFRYSYFKGNCAEMYGREMHD